MKRLQFYKKTIPALVVAFTLMTLTFCFADTITYQCDDLNRVIRVENTTNGTVVEYQYDAVGNRTQKTTTTGGA